MLHQAEVASRRYTGQGQLWQHPYAAPQPRATSALASVWFTAYPAAQIARPGESVLAALVFGKVMETILTEQSAVVRLVGGDNRLTAVVLGGVSLAVAAALCAFVTEPEETGADASSRLPSIARVED